MKQWLSYLLAFLMAISCVSCANHAQQGVFFSEELLTAYGISDFPVLHPEDSRLEGDTFYFNASDEEYEAYIHAVVEYMNQADGIYYFGSPDSNLPATDIAPAKYYVQVPASYNYVKQEHSFAYSLTEELTMDQATCAYYLTDARQIYILRGDFGFIYPKGRYNTSISFTNRQYPACAVHRDEEMTKSILLSAYQALHPEADAVSIRSYYGEYGDRCLVAMMDGLPLLDEVGSEAVGDVIFQYADSNRITVLVKGQLVSLSEAVSKELLTTEEIFDIHEKHKSGVPWLYETAEPPLESDPTESSETALNDIDLERQ